MSCYKSCLHEIMNLKCAIITVKRKMRQVTLSELQSTHGLRYSSIATSLFRGLSLDLDLDISRRISYFFTKLLFKHSILPDTSGSILSLALSILLQVGTKSSLFKNREITALRTFFLDKLTTILLLMLPLTYSLRLQLVYHLQNFSLLQQNSLFLMSHFHSQNIHFCMS